MPHTRAHSRRTVILAATFIAAVIAAAGALALRVSGNDGVVLISGASYTEGVAGTYQRINPLYASLNDVDADISALVFAGMVRLAPDGSVIPDMAELPEISEDDRTYTFTLKDNARWQDGQPVTSRDVAFTIRNITDPDYRGDPALTEGWLGTEVETPDDRTVIVRLRQASAPFLARSATVGILPEHVLGSLRTAELENAAFNSAPVGSGPYRLESVDSREAKLVANERYHLGRPGIERITLRFYTDYATAQRALTEGEIEGLLIRDQLTVDQVSTLGQVKGAQVERLQRSSLVLLYLNASSVMFQDARVRRAFSLAIDREELVRRVYPGGARASSSPIAPGTWAYDETYEDTRPDIAEARRMLEDAGWTANAASGILSRQGSEFRFTIRVDNDAVRVAIAGEIARQLEQLGVRATVASTTFSVLRRDFLQERRYEAAVATWEQGADPDPYFGWHSSQMGSAGLNLANFEDAVVDGLIAQGRTTTDPEVRLDSYEQLQQVWQELAPGVVIAYPDYVYVHPDWLKNVGNGVLFTGSSRFTDVHLWRR